MDLDEPRIAEGLRISIEMVRRIAERARQGGARPVILLIPTKELVYATVMNGQPGMTASYRKLLVMEQKIREEIKRVCERERIDLVDALPHMRQALEAGQRLYPSNTQSHPAAGGYSVIASAVAEAVRDGLAGRDH